ncbi:hypothetical protein, partial [Streptococcus pneumoniae]|uniref:hypothetical protein n=1 Tax=Streptococcus pneumoniae TaxID=1313 RepID=UPI0019549695
MHIPAGIPHRSLSEPSEVVCINLYADASAGEARDALADFVRAYAPGLPDASPRWPVAVQDCS